MDKIKFKDLNVSNMLAFLNNADIEEMQIIEFKKDTIMSKGHPPQKIYVKFASANIADIMAYEFPAGFEILKFPVYKLSKFINTLNVYKSAGYDKLIGTIEYKVIGDELCGEKITINTDKNEMKTTIQKTDLAAIGYLKDSDWAKISDTTNHIIKFDVNKDFVKRIKDLMGIGYSDGNEEKDKFFVMEVNGNVISFRNGKGTWDCKLPDNNITINKQESMKFDLPYRILDWMTTPLQTVYIMANPQPDKFNFLVWENAMSISVNIISTHNPNTYLN